MKLDALGCVIAVTADHGMNAKTRLDQSDIDDIQALYDARAADGFDATANDTRAAADTLNFWQNRISINADISTAACSRVMPSAGFPAEDPRRAGR